MKRGGYGKPWRPPSDGWYVPRKVYFGGLYQHLRPALNNLPRFINNTQATLQPNQVGRPVTRPTQDYSGPAGCENHNVGEGNNLPKATWIGVADASDVPVALGGGLRNTYQQSGTVNLGNQARLRGFKNVQAFRQWHGVHGWLCHDGGGCADTLCGDGSSYESYQATPEQIKYTTISVDLAYHYSDNEPGGIEGELYKRDLTASGSRSVNPLTGQVTSNLLTTLDYYDSVAFWNNPADHGDGFSWTTYKINHVSGGVGWVADDIYDYGSSVYDPPAPADLVHKNLGAGQSTPIDAVAGTDLHCATTPVIPVNGYTLDGFVNQWNIAAQVYFYYYGNYSEQPLIPAITNYNSYATDTGSYTTPEGETRHLQISWTRTNTTFTFNYSYTATQTFTDGFTYNHSETFSGSFTLSNPSTASDLYADAKTLLGYWPLNDDALYPWRPDGVWQIAPLVSRDEVRGNVNPIGFSPYTKDDLRSPATDLNGNAPWSTPENPPPVGWHYAPNNRDSSGRPPSDPDYGGPVPWNATYAQTPWFDDNCYAWKFPAGRDSSNSAAIALVQFTGTGLILGMPLPRALTDVNSYWYDPAFSAPSGAALENFFDYHATIWKACQFTNDLGTYVDFYPSGYGEWLYDAITRTGAMLPHNATQWTNNYQAMRLPPYAYLIQADQQIYDQNGQPSPDNDFHAYQGDGIWAQKCAEIQELWPSQNFFCPAGADRFAPDETAAYCINYWTGDVVTLQSAPTGLSIGDYIGVNNNGNSGIYSVAGVDNSAMTVTLGTFHYPLPTSFTLPSSDQDSCIWKIRFPTAPAILGRDAVASLTDNGDGTTTIILTAADVNLMTGDLIDVCYTTITNDANGNRISELMTPFIFGTAVTRIDDTHFKVALAISALHGAQYIVSHGAPAWYWDDNGRKGDYSVFSWVYDYRTNGEAGRLAGVTDCASHTPPSGSPAANNGYSYFSQTTNSLAFKPCCYSVIAITPNAETWTTPSQVFSFPATFTFDDRYGARWQAEIEQAMVDIYWQGPHTPCGLDGSIGWIMDDGTCQEDSDTVHYYPHFPLVESRVSLPANGGNSQTETAPALPSGFSLAHGNPTTYPAVSNALYPPGMIGYDPSSGNPSGAWTAWGYRQTIENSACFGGCHFDYVGMENLPCVVSYSGLVETTPPQADTAATSSTADGNTGT